MIRPSVSHALALALGVAALAPSAQAARVKASSELTDREGTVHGAENAFDGLLSTGWSEGEMGVGEGSWIELDLGEATDVASVSIWPGDLSNGERSLKENGRPHTVTVTLEGGDEPISRQVRVRDGAKVGLQRVDVDVRGTARTIRITIDDAYAGFLYNDTYIAEVAVNFSTRTGSTAKAMDRLAQWQESRAGVSASEAHETEVIRLFDVIDQAEFGDRDSLRTLMGFATDGAPYLQEQVRRYVPAGYRIQALPPDPMSIEALLKIKDPNAIPALRVAALRSGKQLATKLKVAASYFEAFASLDSGGRRSIPIWGDTGWERGALQGLGEPLAIGLGVYGDVYVADVANHRVQVFTREGTVRSAWGRGEPEVTQAWYGGKREFYVAGSAPSTDPGGFSNPIDLTVVQDKDDETVYVLDALGRVQWFRGSTGERLGGFTAQAETGVSPGVGGEGFVLVVKGKVVVVWGNEVIVHDEEGTELSRYDLEEGVPVDVVGMKNGKLLVGYRDLVAIYNLDGFRHGDVLEDALPRGYESYTMTLDERGKLWIVTDHGYALKYKKPGKEDYRVQWKSVGVDVPRIAVFEDLLHVAHGDAIEVVDALELKAEAELAAEEE